ncbi:MAG TPA: hypothetical protein VI248_06525 [Kineosporiaceae bacterium]
MELTAPTPVRSHGRDAFMWRAVLGGVPHRIAWSTDDKKIRISWEDGDGWSRFVTLGSRWSPQEDLFGAQAAVEDWARHRETTITSRSVG